MSKQFLKTSRFFVIVGALSSAMGLGSFTPANAVSFKGKVYDPAYDILENLEIEYTLADGIFDTVISSPANTFFSDQSPDLYSDPGTMISSATLVPEVVTEFKWTMGGTLEPLDVKHSMFGITDEGLFLRLLDPDGGSDFLFTFTSIIEAPEGLPLSACKTQTCDASADYGAKGGYHGSRMTHTPINESQSVPEPSATVALGLVSTLLWKRHRKGKSIKKC